MSRSDHARLESDLRALDPAGPGPDRPDENQRARADALLAQIVRTDPTALPLVPSKRFPRHTSRLVPAIALAAAVAVVTAVAVPLVTGGDEAFAGWSPVPVELVGAERDTALDACTTLQVVTGDGGELTAAPGATATPLVVEARGGWTYVLYRVAALEGGFLEGSCLMPDDVVADPVPGAGGSFGSLGSAEDALEPPRRPGGLREDTSGVGDVDEGVFAYASGTVGVDVARVFVDLADGRRVEATVEDGRWAAWWPAGPDGSRDPSVTEAWTYAVVLSDGTERPT